MSLLPRSLLLPADIPLVLDRVPPMASPRPETTAPVNDWSCSTAGDGAPKRVRLRLTDEADAEAADFLRAHGDGNCSCHISPPCSSCTHPGNPANLEEDDSAWVMGFDGDAA